MFVYLKDNIVVGLSSIAPGIPENDEMLEIDDIQRVTIGDSIVDGVFYSRDGVPSLCLSKLAFMNRFTLYELAAIEASTDPIVKVLQRQQQVAEYVDLKEQKTVEGVGYLVSIGIITAARMQEILSAV